MIDITLIRGDGIGPEVTDSARKVLESLTDDLNFIIMNAGIEMLEKHGTLVPDAV